MVQATTPMAKDKPDESQARGYCTYTSMKVDDELMPEIKAAAAFDRKSVQELVSDILNDYVAKRFKHQKINRRPPPPREKRKTSGE